jgi:hypothetical protein
MAPGEMGAYSRTIETGMSDMAMNLQLALRTLALLALVAASTAMLVGAGPLGAPGTAAAPAFAAMLVIGHN